MIKSCTGSFLVSQLGMFAGPGVLVGRSITASFCKDGWGGNKMSQIQPPPLPSPPPLRLPHNTPLPPTTEGSP